MPDNKDSKDSKDDNQPLKTFANPLRHKQLHSHCGPASLAACLFILGIYTNQRSIAKSLGLKKSQHIWENGFNESDIIHAAHKFNVLAFPIQFDKQTQYKEFISNLKYHLKSGYPAILLIHNFSHWISLVNYSNHKFLTFDTKNKSFHKYSQTQLKDKCWNVSELSHAPNDIKDPSQFYAILIKHKDDLPPKWKITEKSIRYFKQGKLPPLSP